MRKLMDSPLSVNYRQIVSSEKFLIRVLFWRIDVKIFEENLMSSAVFIGVGSSCRVLDNNTFDSSFQLRVSGGIRNTHTRDPKERIVLHSTWLNVRYVLAPLNRWTIQFLSIPKLARILRLRHLFTRWDVLGVGLNVVVFAVRFSHLHCFY